MPSPEDESPRAAEHPLWSAYCQLEARLLALQKQNDLTTQPDQQALIREEELRQAVSALAERIGRDCGFPGATTDAAHPELPQLEQKWGELRLSPQGKQAVEALIELGNRIRSESGFAQQEAAIKEQLEQIETVLLLYPPTKL